MEVLLSKPWRMRPPHLRVWAPWVKVEVLVTSQWLAVVPELPTCAPPLENAPSTISAGSLLPPDKDDVDRMNWKRVSLTRCVFTTAVSVACTVFSVLIEL